MPVTLNNASDYQVLDNQARVRVMVGTSCRCIYGHQRQSAPSRRH